MRVLIIGGTRFIGSYVARALDSAGQQVTLFHRGQTAAELPSRINHITGERGDLRAFADEFKQLAPQVVLDMICYNEQEAQALMQTLRGLTARVVVTSSMDVYSAYGGLLGLEAGPPATVPFNEDAPLRTALYPYRGGSKEPDEFAFNYEKILVERVVMGDAQLPGTILRLPAVYGPGDQAHRPFEYLKRIADGRRVILLGKRQAQWRWTRGYVENVADAIALAVIDERATGRIYNVGEARALNEAEWARAIGEAAGWPGEVVTMPDAELPAHLRAPYHWEHHLDGDTTRIREELGYAERIASRDARAATIAWERTNPPEKIDAERFDYAAEDAALAPSNSPRNSCD